MIPLDPKSFKRAGYRTEGDRTFVVIWDIEGNELSRTDVTDEVAEQNEMWSEVVKTWVPGGIPYIVEKEVKS